MHKWLIKMHKWLVSRYSTKTHSDELGLLSDNKESLANRASEAQTEAALRGRVKTASKPSHRRPASV